MAVGSSKRCAKILLLVLNGCCIVVAILGIAFSLVDIYTVSQYGVDRSIGTCVGDVVCMSVCMMLVATVAFGSVGVVKEHARILYMYIGFLMIMIVLEMMIVIYMFVQRYDLEFQLSEWLREDFFRNTTDLDDHAQKKVWDNLQSSYECCGFNGPEDYIAMQKQVSLSCCPRAHHARTTYAQHQLYNSCIQDTGYYSVGCEDQILLSLRSDDHWLFTIALTSFLFEGMGMILAKLVARHTEDNELKYRKTTLN